jgi:hypothetical protein
MDSGLRFRFGELNCDGLGLRASIVGDGRGFNMGTGWESRLRRGDVNGRSS